MYNQVILIICIGRSDTLDLWLALITAHIQGRGFKPHIRTLCVIRFPPQFKNVLSGLTGASMFASNVWIGLCVCMCSVLALHPGCSHLVPWDRLPTPSDPTQDKCYCKLDMEYLSEWSLCIEKIDKKLINIPLNLGSGDADCKEEQCNTTRTTSMLSIA